MPTKSVKGTASTHKVLLLDISSYTLWILYTSPARPASPPAWAQPTPARPPGRRPKPHHATRAAPTQPAARLSASPAARLAPPARVARTALLYIADAR